MYEIIPANLAREKAIGAESAILNKWLEQFDRNIKNAAQKGEVDSSFIVKDIPYPIRHKIWDILQSKGYIFLGTTEIVSVQWRFSWGEEVKDA